MTVEVQGRDETLATGAVMQSAAADFGPPAVSPVAAKAPAPSGSFAVPREVPIADRSGAAPHFLGSLLIASSAGFIGCVAALLFGRSLLESLAVYSLSGGIIFVALLVVRSGSDGAGD